MRQTSRTVSTAAALLIGGLSAACGLDWALDEVPGNTDLRDASDDTRVLPDGGLNGPPRACSRNAPCYFDEYCDYEDGKCGASGEGVCKLRPNSCTAVSPPQCGCDGRRYTMACEAHRAGIDDGAANAPEYFACGPTKQCQVGQEYCLVNGLLTARTYQCKSFNGCSAADCSCARKIDVCLTCTEVAGGGTLNDCSL